MRASTCRSVVAFAFLALAAAWSGNANAACSSPAAPEGSINYDISAHAFRYCDDTNTWKSFGGGGTLATLTDVSASAPLNNQILQYNSSLSKWAAVSMTTGAFVCPAGFTMISKQGQTLGCMQAAESATSGMYAAADACYNSYGGRLPSFSEYRAARAQGGFTAATANWLEDSSGGGGAGEQGGVIGTTGVVSYDNASSSWKYRCFIPTVGVISGTTALGDRITSGTLAMTANSATSYVSLSTGATTWGYLANAASYLPNLSSNYVSASGVSVSGVVQVSGSALTCSSAIKGAIRYSNISNTLEYCNSAAWASLEPSASVVGPYLRLAYSGSLARQNIIPYTVAESGGGAAWSSNRFTAVIPGVYFIAGTATGFGATYIAIDIQKNGSNIARTYGANSSTTKSGSSHSSVITYLNVGDYIDFFYSHDSVVNMTAGDASIAYLGSGVSSGGGASTLNDLTDVDTSGAAAGNVIRYNGSNWVVSTSGGGALSQLTDTNITNVAGRAVRRSWLRSRRSSRDRTSTRRTSARPLSEPRTSSLLLTRR